MCIFLEPGPTSHSSKEWVPHPTLCPRVIPGGCLTCLHLRSLSAAPMCEQDQEKIYFGLSALEQMDDFHPALAADPLWSWAKETCGSGSAQLGYGLKAVGLGSGHW